MTVGEHYDEIAHNLSDVERVLSTYRDLVEIPSFLNALGPLEGTRVLDLGCGSGTYTRLLKERGAAHVVGVDISPGMVEAARRAEARHPLGLHYEVQDAAGAPALGEFDTVVAVAVLHYAKDRPTLEAMVGTAVANLAPGGRLVTYVGNPELPAGTAQMNGLVMDRPAHPADGAPCSLTIPTVPPTVLPVRYWSRGALEEALRSQGLQGVRWEPVHGLPAGAGGPINLLLSAHAPG